MSVDRVKNEEFYTISDLEEEGYIRRKKIGRRNVYNVDPQLPLRHHTKTDIMVEDLLESLTAAST